MATRVSRRVILGIDELMGVLDGVLAEYADPVVVGVMDTDHIAIALLEDYCYGHSTLDIEATFSALKIPRDVRTQILEEARHRLYNVIQTAFRYVYPSRIYAFQTHSRTIVVNEYIQDYQHEKTTDEPQDSAGEIDGFIPERQRRRA